MAKIGRNQPCPCGSGVKAKRCCGVPRGPSEDQLAAAFLHTQARQWIPLLIGLDNHQLDDALDEVLLLPQADIALHAPLPRLFPPGLQRLALAIAADDTDALTEAIPAAMDRIDTPTLRARLARTVLTLHEVDLVDDDVAAYAILDLATSNHARSALVCAAVTEALAVATGTNPTPSGLVVAAR